MSGYTSEASPDLAKVLLSQSQILAANFDNGPFGGLSNKFINDHSLLADSNAASFTGKDFNGNPQTMTFTASNTVQSTYGALHSITTASLTHSYYNANNALWLDQNAQFDFAGSPSVFRASGIAEFNDTLQFGGPLQNGYLARYIFHLDGNASGTGTKSGVGVRIGANPFEVFFNTSTGPVSTDWSTQDYFISGSTPQTVDVQLLSQINFNTAGLIDGQNYDGISDFSSTLRLIGIEVRDANRNLTNGWTVTSASGTHYNTIQGGAAAVPEPGTVALFVGLSLSGIGILPWGLRNGRRRVTKAHNDSRLLF